MEETKPALNGARAGHRLAALEHGEFGMEFGGSFVALLEIGMAGADDDLVQFGELGALGGGLLDEVRWKLGEFLTVAASGHFVEHPAEAEDVGLRRARSFRGQITFGAHDRKGGLGVGDQTNIGAGTITCNYDGKHKHPTIIEDNVKIGSDTMLVAPVRVGKGSMTAAGAVVTEDVPPGTLVAGVPAKIKKKLTES